MVKKKQIPPVAQLFADAIAQYPSQKSHKLVKQARLVAMEANYRLPSEFRRQYCHSCYHLLVAGKNCSVRTRSGWLLHTCKDCLHINRFKL